jgi:hypothetical protein
LRIGNFRSSLISLTSLALYFSYFSLPLHADET